MVITIDAAKNLNIKSDLWEVNNGQYVWYYKFCQSAAYS